MIHDKIQVVTSNGIPSNQRAPTIDLLGRVRRRATYRLAAFERHLCFLEQVDGHLLREERLAVVVLDGRAEVQVRFSSDHGLQVATKLVDPENARTVQNTSEINTF